MAEQQLIDYITKARSAGQADAQTRDLLYKNGWTEVEVNDAILALTQPKVDVQPVVSATPNVTQPTTQPAASVELKPELELQAGVQEKPEIKPEPQISVQPQVQAEKTAQPIANVAPDIMEPAVAVQPQPEVQAKTETWPELQVQSQVQAQPEIQPQAQPQMQPLQPQAQASSMPMQNNLPQMKTKSHGFLKFLIVLIILVVIGGAGYFVAGKYFNFASPSPETVIAKMLQNMASVKTSHSVIQMEADIIDNASKTNQGKFLLNATGDTDTTDLQNIKSNDSFSLNLTIPGSDTPVASFGANVISIDKDAYLKISTITIPNAFSYPGLDVSQINGKWFKIDQSSYDTLLQAESGQAQTITLPSTDNSALIKKAEDLAIAENMFTFNKKLSDETVSGQDTYHYLVTINKDKLKDYITKVMALETQQQAAQGGSTAANQDMVQAIIQSFVSSTIDSIGDVNVEMWIGKKDYMLYQAKIDKVVDISKMIGFDSSVEIKFDNISSDFNKPITVQAPTNTQKIETVLLPLLKIQQINSDMNKIGLAADDIFTANSSYYAVCKNGFLNGSKTTSYGITFVTSVKDLLKNGEKNPVCYAAAKSYCVSTQLVDGTYLCVDQNGMLGKTKCTSSTTVCQ